jgi:hypothetical protein
MCPFITCRTVVSCTEHECIYANDPDGDACFDGRGVCQTGQCVCGAGGVCPSGQTCCNGQCIDTNSDRFNCGDCGVECVDGVCDGGECVPCDGITCGSQCLEPPAECCTIDDCQPKQCQSRLACSAEHVCLYEDLPDGTPCGFIDEGDACFEGQCIPGGGSV